MIVITVMATVNSTVSGYLGVKSILQKIHKYARVRTNNNSCKHDECVLKKKLAHGYWIPTSVITLFGVPS